ncbi:fimbrial protein [Comamonas composti]|uniref:fimbrial protein n=1 Tax=Comamonas composti TaxID=408558 RepID=UPI0003FC30BB|nr:fimbrial protein [Comamonas composti]
MTVIRCAFFAMLLAAGMAQRAWSECVNQGIPLAGTMEAKVTLQLTGDIPADTYLGSFDFKRDGGTAPIAQCSPGSEVALYATHGEGVSMLSRYYKHIDGRPTYHLYTAGEANYAYAIEDLETGVYFTREGTMSGREGPLNTPMTRLHLYAATDNPSPTKANAHVGALLVRRFEVGYTNVGFHFRMTPNIQTAKSCKILNKDLRIRLPGISVSNFPHIGFAQQPVRGRDNLTVECTGEMTASILVKGNHGATTHEGRNIVLKPMDEGWQSNATGFGFVLSAPGFANGHLVHDEYVSLGGLPKGQKIIPIEAEYYRYGNAPRPGEVESSASFILQFN